MNYKTMNQEDVLLQTLEYARQAGADHAVCICNAWWNSTLRFAINQATQHKENETCHLNLAVAVDQQEAVVQTNNLETPALKALANRAVEYARFAPRNPEFFPPVSARDYEFTTTWFDATANMTLENRSRMIQDVCHLAESRNVHLYGNLNQETGSVAVANSSGLHIHQPYTDAKLSLTARTPSGNGSSQNILDDADISWWDTTGIAQNTIDMALKSINPQRLEPGEYTVILSPRAALEYLSFVLYPMDARMAAQGYSFYSSSDKKGTRIGERIFGDAVTIRSLFNHPRLSTMAFGQAFGMGGSHAGMLFSYGLPMQNHTWIEQGILKKLRYSPYWAMANGLEPVGYPFNIVLDSSSELSVEELIRSTKRGVFISSFWYVNPTDMNNIEITGLTRDGTFLIENGEIVQPLMNFRFNDSPVTSLNSIEAMSKAEKVTGEYLSGILPYLKIARFHLTSVSDAI